MKYPVHNIKSEKVKDIELNSQVFEVPLNEGLVHQVAMAQIASRRKNVAHTKDRSDVRGGGKKPWRQKGTGRARHGSNRSPIWIGGGVTFGPRATRNFSLGINKKMKRKALFVCLSDRVKDNQLFVFDALRVDESKTKNFVKIIEDNKKLFDLERKSGSDKSKFDIKDYRISMLVLVDENVRELSRAVRNIPGVKVLSAESANVVDVLSADKLVATEKAIEKIEKVFLAK